MVAVGFPCSKINVGAFKFISPEMYMITVGSLILEMYVDRVGSFSSET